MSYQSAKIQVEQLVERFAQLSARNRKGYNEPATRQEFILPLFRALGWNVEDTREVSPEERVSRGYVDFSFRLRGIPCFFLETKKIPEDLEDPRWARQAINYAWLKGVTWAVLTDFEGLKVFNAEWQETIPVRAIFKDLYWDEYLDRFDDLWLLSRPAMEEGALDRAAEAVGKKAKKTPVSRQLFADLTEWRRELFRHLRPYNPKWGIEQIDEAVQRILDRLIFIRTCEDRELEPYRLRSMLRQWRDQGRKKDLVKELNLLFREFDQVYDTRLFAPHLCEELTSEPTPFAQIIEGLYQVPGGYGDYDFNAIDADVMGTIYEQYLGHRAQDPEGKQVVDKRAKRKAQGIYYTPQFVVRYVVGQTLGRLLEERDYEQARQVKVLDMACGSGSFLIEAFDVLDRYLAEVRGQNAASAAGDMHDFARRMEILTGNLYGVDLDAQAVEIAQLNLLLKAMNQRGRLPDLTNIRQGNSLISGMPKELEAAFGPNWRDKRPFNWEEEFPRVFTPTPTLPLPRGGQGGGFDVIVGNPPYIRIQTLPKSDVAWYGDHYQVASGNYDIYVLFVERALQLLRPGGVFGMILPNKFLQVDYGRELRKLLSQQKAVSHIVDFEHAQVFEDATTYTCLLFLRKETNEKVLYIAAGDWLKAETEQPAVLSDSLPEVHVNSRGLTDEPWIFFSEMQTQIKQKLISKGVPLLNLPAKMSRGSSTGNDKVFVLRRGSGDTYFTDEGESVKIEAEILRTPLFATDFNRYSFTPRSGKVIIFPYRKGGSESSLTLLPEFELKRQFPKAYSYLRSRKEILEQRKQFNVWYGFSAPRNLAIHDQAHLVVPLLADRGSLAELPDDRDNYCLMASGGFSISIEKDSRLSPRYVLGLLNSKLLFWYLAMMSNRFRGGWITCTKQYVGQLPIHRINFDDPADVAQHDRMVSLVEEMLRVQKEHAQAEALKEDRRHDLARQIERLDAQIDALVYELYGLTEEEIEIVEG